MVKHIFSILRSTEYEGFDHNTLDSVFTENDKDEVADASESDGYLSEVSDPFLILDPYASVCFLYGY